MRVEYTSKEELEGFEKLVRIGVITPLYRLKREVLREISETGRQKLNNPQGRIGQEILRETLVRTILSYSPDEGIYTDELPLLVYCVGRILPKSFRRSFELDFSRRAKGY